LRAFSIFLLIRDFSYVFLFLPAFFPFLWQNLWQICGNEKGTPLGVPIRLYSEIIYTVLLVFLLQMYIGLGGKTHRFVPQHLGHKLGIAVCQFIQFGCTGMAESVQTRLLNLCQSQ
jgi:hypothetical protein